MTARRTAARPYPWLLGLGPLALAALMSVSTPACSSKSSGSLGGDDEGDASGSSSGAGGSSSSGSGAGSSSSGAAGSSGSSGGSSSSTSARVPSNIVFTDAGVPLCGSDTPCDLTKNICCVSDTAQGAEGSCQTSACTSNQASFECLQASDCAGGKVCCGYANNSGGLASAGSTCQTGDPCTPIPDAGAQSTVGSAQLCQTDAECKNSMHCIWQVCTIHTTVDTVPVTIYPNLTMCGLQTVAPYQCSECPGAPNCASQAQ